MIIKSYEILKNISNFSKYNMFLLYGENFGLQKDIKEKINSIFRKKDNSAEMLSFYENEIIENDENLFNTVYGSSLFSNFKIITINNATDKIFERIKKISEKKTDDSILIIFSNILDKKSKLRNFFEKDSKIICVPCYGDTSRDLQFIVNSELKKNNIILSQESINLLIENSNNDRGNLKNEIDKIKAYATTNKNLDNDTIKLIINFSGDYKSDILINECLCGNVSQYKKILSELYSYTVNYIFLLRILSNKIQRLLLLKEAQNENNNLDNLLNTSRPPIFWKEKPMVKKQLTIWDLEDLKKIINEINQVELSCKKNPNISKAIFFSFFTNLCKKASNYS